MSQYSFLDLDDPPVLSNLLVARTFRQMWQEAWAAFRGEWPRWIGLTLIGYAPPLLVGLLLPSWNDLYRAGSKALESGSLERVSTLREILIWGLVSFLAAVISWGYTVLVLQGAGAVMASQILAHQPASLRKALRAMLTRRGAALLAGNLLFAFTLLAIGLLSTVTSVCLVGLFGFAFLFYIVLVWPPLLVPLLALERGSLIRLLSRAWYFGRQRVWVVVAVVASLYALGFAASLPLTWLQNLALPDMVSLEPDGVRVLTQDYWEWQTIFILLSLIVQCVLLPLAAILHTILYYDARARLDPPDADLAIAAGDPPNSRESWVTTKDLANTVLLGLFGMMVAGLLTWISAAILNP